MIEDYLREIDELISSAPEVIDVEIVRRSVWDTGLEKVALYHYRLSMSDGSLLELTERLVEKKGTLFIKKYRYHWQNRNGQVIMRWDQRHCRDHRCNRVWPFGLYYGQSCYIISLYISQI